MKLLKIAIILVVVLAVLYCFLWIFINLKGKKILKDKLTSLTGKEVQVDSLSFVPPIGIKIDNLSIDRTVLRKIKLSLSFLKAVTGTLGFNEIYIKDASLDIIKDKKKLETPFLLPLNKSKPKNLIKKAGKISKSQATLKSRVLKIFVKNLKLENVRVNFKDNSKDKIFQDSLYNLEANIHNLGCPLIHKTFFDISSSFKLDNSLIEDALSFKGFIDFKTKSMDASLKIKKIPYRSFSVYYPPFWKPDNLGVEKAKFSLVAFFKAINNDLTIDCTLRLLNYKFKETEEGGTRLPFIKGILESFKDSQGIPTLYFQIKTKLDNPKLDFSTIKLKAKSKIKISPVGLGKEAVKKVTNVGKQVTTKAIDITGKAIGEALKTPERAKDIMKETGKTLKSIFVSEEEETPQEKPPQENK